MLSDDKTTKPDVPGGDLTAEDITMPISEWLRTLGTHQHDWAQTMVGGRYVEHECLGCGAKRVVLIPEVRA